MILQQFRQTGLALWFFLLLLVESQVAGKTGYVMRVLSRLCFPFPGTRLLLNNGDL
jgi:hypothetical protein